jgi:hypothetical protein
MTLGLAPRFAVVVTLAVDVGAGTSVQDSSQILDSPNSGYIAIGVVKHQGFSGLQEVIYGFLSERRTLTRFRVRLLCRLRIRSRIRYRFRIVRVRDLGQLSTPAQDCLIGDGYIYFINECFDGREIFTAFIPCFYIQQQQGASTVCPLHHRCRL